MEWEKPEQAFLWAIYERAVLDAFGVAGYRGYDLAKQDRSRTSSTGFIRTPQGRKVNILELLDISPQWATEQLQVLNDYTKLKEAA
jgi:hypothetical protein